MFIKCLKVETKDYDHLIGTRSLACLFDQPYILYFTRLYQNLCIVMPPLILCTQMSWNLVAREFSRRSCRALLNHETMFLWGSLSLSCNPSKPLTITTSF